MTATDTAPARFTGNLAEPPALPEESIAAANRLLGAGKLFRYVETGDGFPEAALLEEEFAALMGARYCIGANSGGGALFLSLKAAGVAPGDPVLVNAFTLAPVPGAIAHACARPVLVDITEDLVIDLDDLVAKARETGAKVLLLSHMRGHLADLDRVEAICEAEGLTLIEDCAHTTLARWGGRLAGRVGRAGCFSAQSYKHLNGGEGGLIVTDDADLAARAVLMSGSYMLYGQHRARPEEEVFARWKGEMPNFSLRLNGLVAAILRPQLPLLDSRVRRWREIHALVAGGIARSQNLRLPETPSEAWLTPTSIQFLHRPAEPKAIGGFIARAGALGVPVKWFGADEPVGFTSRPDHWGYVPGEAPPRALATLRGLCDVRLPLGLTDAEARQIGDILAHAAEPG